MTYTLTLMGIHHCKPNVCYERIPNISGLLEEVLDGVVTFHSVKGKDVNKALDYLANRYGRNLVYIESEHITGCFCQLELICAIEI